MIQKKVLLYLPFKSPFYDGLYLQMKKGFEQCGCLVNGGSGYLSSNDLIKEIDLFKPDFVFEMNRIKSDIENFPKEIIHICWLVDYWDKSYDDISNGCEMLYVFSEPWLAFHHNFRGIFIDVLPPGTDTDIYMLKKDKDINNRFIFLGHLPKPWTQEELNREIKISSRSIKFKEIMESVHYFTMNPFDYKDSTISIEKYLMSKFEADNIELTVGTALHYDVFGRSFREGRRIGVLKKFLTYSKDINIYGGDSWLLREEFKANHRCFLNKPEEIAKVFNENTFLLHDGNMPHFRTFDAMASGLLVFKPDVTGYGISNEWDNFNFQENRDIFTYKLDNDDSFVCNLLQKDIFDIRHSIREEIKSSHTWMHRAAKILGDVEYVKQNK